ncbi:cholinesterase 2 [Aplysia californica]|uniref:Carboxylic ester hydrolase n=1 Tax=Aplysia californica TaxID=6500 RepID=A0ABM1A0E1_APLCA|nr:cholinesterase 2 [Aplysia californica]
MERFSALHVAFILCFAQPLLASVTVDSSFGVIEGSEHQAINGRSYVSFRGIPYAKPPVGELRFAKSEMHPKLEGTFDGTKEPVACIRPEPYLLGNPQGLEDCLVLNVFMGELTVNPDKPKKVIVYIHGGGFFVGASREFIPGTMVTTHDIIVVVINYRLGVLGFLSTEDEVSPGNFGMWDQALALKWVKTHIASFGGDPDDITITGESAGGVSVQLLSISPYGKGLFAKAFPGSGGASMISTRISKPRVDALECAVHFKCWEGSTEDTISAAQSQEVIACLRKVPEAEFGKYLYFGIDRSRFFPRADGDFVPDSPKLLLQNELYLDSVGFFDRSYLVYLNNNERAQMAAFIAGARYIANMNETATQEEKDLAYKDMLSKGRNAYLLSGLDVSYCESLFEKLYDWYERRATFEDAVTDIMTDGGFVIPTFDFLKAAAQKGSTNVSFFLFDHYPHFMRKLTDKGMVHGLDVPYLLDYDVDYLGKLMGIPLSGKLDGEELIVKNEFIALTVEFMKSG